MNMHMLEKCIAVRKEIKSKGYIPEWFHTFEITKFCSIIYLKIQDNTIIAERDIPDGYDLVYLVNYDGGESKLYHSKNKHIFIKDNDFKSFFGMVIIDEAYTYFYQKNSLKLINEYDNVVILRTFSKMLSLPAIRLGAIVSNKQNIQYINNIIRI